MMPFRVIFHSCAVVADGKPCRVVLHLPECDSVSKARSSLHGAEDEGVVELVVERPQADDLNPVGPHPHGAGHVAVVRTADKLIRAPLGK